MVVVVKWLSGKCSPRVPIITLCTPLASLVRPMVTSRCMVGVMIAGASTGIGKNATVYLAQKGYYVIAGVRSKEHLEMYKKMEGVNVTAISLDVTKDNDIANALKTVTSEMAKRDLKFAGLVSGER